eukprot:6207741-Pleurochrysis_carterae.AAC.2
MDAGLFGWFAARWAFSFTAVAARRVRLDSVTNTALLGCHFNAMRRRHSHLLAEYPNVQVS